MALLHKLLPGSRLRQTVGQLLQEAQTVEDERRRGGRRAFFKPVMIQLQDSPELYSAFTRDLSEDGIGLLHWMPITPQIMNITIKLHDGTAARLLVDIEWCSPCGEGWYISGGRFRS